MPLHTFKRFSLPEPDHSHAGNPIYYFKRLMHYQRKKSGSLSANLPTNIIQIFLSSQIASPCSKKLPKPMRPSSQ